MKETEKTARRIRLRRASLLERPACGGGGGYRTMAKPSIFTLASTDGWRRRSVQGGFGPLPDSPRRRSEMTSSRSCVLAIGLSAARSSADSTGSPETMHRHRGAEDSDISNPSQRRHGGQATRN